MAERNSPREAPGQEDADRKIAGGIDVFISIGHHNRHQLTYSNSDTPHIRNIITDGGSNNHVGNDAHEDATTLSGTVYGSSLSPFPTSTYESRARSMPPPLRSPPDQTDRSPQDSFNTPTPSHLGLPYPTSNVRRLSDGALSHPWTPVVSGVSELRSNSYSTTRQGDSSGTGLAQEGAFLPMATYPNHAFNVRQRYCDQPPHQDVAIQYLRDDTEASTQIAWIDDRLIGRVIELSEEGSNLHRRAMVVMAISSGVRYLQCVHICRHPEMLSQVPEFCGTHVAVFDKNRPGHSQDIVGGHTAPPVSIVIEETGKYALRGYCYINCQHVWTVRRDVKTRNIGFVEDFQRFKENFRKAQKRLHGY